MHDLPGPSLPTPSRPSPSSSSSFHPGTRKPRARWALCRARGDGAPRPLLLVVLTPPAEPWLCIPLSLPRTRGGIKGKVARACLIWDLWTETRLGAAAGARVRGPDRGRAGPGCLAFSPGRVPRPGARSAAAISDSARGRARCAPAGRHQRGQPFHGRLHVTIFGLARRHLGCLAFNCLLVRRRCPESASVARDATSPTSSL